VNYKIVLIKFSALSVGPKLLNI